MTEKVMILGSFAESLVRFRGRLIEELLKAGREVVACAPEIPVAVRERLEGMGARVIEVPMRRAGLNPLSDAALLLHLVRLLRCERPDVLFAYTIKPVVYGGIAARLVGGIRFTPMITGLGYAFTSGGGLRRRVVSSLAQMLYRFALTSATRVFFQNPDDLAVFVDGGILGLGAPTQLIAGSGIDICEFQPTPLPQAAVFLMIGRLVTDKGVREYASAASMVRKVYPSARFLLAGWIDENPTAITATELGEWVTSGNIEFLGKLEDVRPALNLCSVYVLPSYREGTPRTVLEAMAMGRAVVTTDAPGCRETVMPGENGFLVPSRDAASLALQLKELVAKPGLLAQLGKRSRAIAEDRYDVRKVNAEIIRGMGLAC